MSGPIYCKGGGGDVNGPGATTDTAIASWDGIDGMLLQNNLPRVNTDGRITDGTDPVDPQDFTTKAWVEGIINSTSTTEILVLASQRTTDFVYPGPLNNAVVVPLGDGPQSNAYVSLTGLYSGTLTFLQGGVYKIYVSPHIVNGAAAVGGRFLLTGITTAPVTTFFHSTDALLADANHEKAPFLVFTLQVVANQIFQLLFEQNTGNTTTSPHTFKAVATNYPGRLVAGAIEAQVWKIVESTESLEQIEINAEFDITEIAVETIVLIDNGTSVFQVSFDFTAGHFLIINHPGGSTLDISFSLDYPSDGQPRVFVTPTGVVGPPANILQAISPSSNTYLTEDGTSSAGAALSATNDQMELSLNTSVAAVANSGNYVKIYVSQSDKGYIFTGFYRTVALP